VRAALAEIPPVHHWHCRVEIDFLISPSIGTQIPDGVDDIFGGQERLSTSDDDLIVLKEVYQVDGLPPTPD